MDGFTSIHGDIHEAAPSELWEKASFAPNKWAAPSPPAIYVRTVCSFRLLVIYHMYSRGYVGHGERRAFATNVKQELPGSIPRAKWSLRRIKKWPLVQCMYHLQALKQLSVLGAERWKQTTLHPARIPFGACFNYKAVIWRHFLSTFPVDPSSKHYGWGINFDGLLVTQWMCGTTASHTAFQLLFCMCKRSWKLPGCICLNSYMNCTNLWKIANQFKPVPLWVPSVYALWYGLWIT